MTNIRFHRTSHKTRSGDDTSFNNEASEKPKRIKRFTSKIRGKHQSEEQTETNFSVYGKINGEVTEDSSSEDSSDDSQSKPKGIKRFASKIRGKHQSEEQTETNSSVSGKINMEVTEDSSSEDSSDDSQKPKGIKRFVSKIRGKHQSEEQTETNSSVYGKINVEVTEDSSSEEQTEMNSISSDILKLKGLKTKYNKMVLEEYQKIPHQEKNDSTYGVFNVRYNSKSREMYGAINAEGALTGVCEFYKSKHSKTLLAVISFDDNGKKDGKELRFHSNGALQVRASYEDDIKEGKELTYYDDGSIKSIKTYHNNVIAGNPECTYEPAHIEYYKTGIPSMRVSYNKDGKKEGLTLLMDTKGRIIEKQWYEDGVPARIWEKILYLKGNSTPYVAKKKYTDEPIDILDDCQALPKDYTGEAPLAHDKYGLLHGEQIYKTTFTLDELSGSEVDVIKRVHYQHGIKDGETRIESDDEERKLLSKTTYKAGLKTTQSIYEDIDEDIYEDIYEDIVEDIEKKRICYEWQMKYGVKHGTIVKETPDREWDEDNEHVQEICTKEEVEYRFGQKHGTAKYYDENNKLRYISQYKAGELNGIAIEYYEDGHQIENITEYHNDKQNGMAISCDTDGNITTITHYVDDKQDGIELDTDDLDDEQDDEQDDD